MKGQVRQISVLLTGIIMVGVNIFISNKGSLRGTGPDIDLDPTTFYNLYPTSFSPIPVTFVIWLPIFLGLIVFSIYQALPAQRNDRRFDMLGGSVVAAFIFNTVQAVGPIAVNTFGCVATVISLIFTIRTLTELRQNNQGVGLLTRLPLTLFLGWMTVATSLSISQLLTSLGFAGFGLSPALWSAGLILVAAGVGFFVIQRTAFVAYGAAILWGFWGIVAANSQAPNVVVTLVATVAIVWVMVKAWRLSQAQDASAEERLTRA